MPSPPNLTLDRIREALLLLQAVEATGEWGLDVAPTGSASDGGWRACNWDVPGRVYRNHSWAPTLTEALTGLLDALQVEPWAWPSEEAVKGAREHIAAGAVEGRNSIQAALWAVHDLRDLFARDPLTVLRMLGRRDA